MKILGFLIVLTAFSSISDIRAVYQSQDEDRVLAALKELEAKVSLSSDEQCYKAVFTCMKADYLSWPNEKLGAFKKGYGSLNKIITANPANAEYRYHRYMVEKHAPSWLIDVNHMKGDKAYVKANLKTNHPMYSFISRTIDK